MTSITTSTTASTQHSDALLDAAPQLSRLLSRSLSYSSTFAINMLHDRSNPALYVHVPYTLLPTPIPQTCFDITKNIAPIFNKLIDKMSRNYEFLTTSLQSSAAVDPFLSRLLSLYLRLYSPTSSIRPPSLRCGLFRSDYMMEYAGCEEATPLQVEINTIAAGLGGLSTKISAMHRHQYERELQLSTAQLPENNTIQHMAFTVSVAVNKFHQIYPTAPISTMLMVVQMNEWNLIDQNLLEYTLWNNHRIPVIRHTLREIHELSRVVDNQLYIDDQLISFVYFRAGYTPKDFISEVEWSALERMEISAAVKCPSLPYHLCGTKKIQQLLSARGGVEQFLAPDEAAAIRRVFTGQWTLDNCNEETKHIIAEAIAQPNQFVLKPQREGGGNNVWGDDLVEKLTNMNVDERSAYILMKRINPRSYRAALVRGVDMIIKDTVSEYGVFAGFVGDDHETHHNSYCGFLLRTKVTGVNEGGIAAGYSYIDSPVLI